MEELNELITTYFPRILSVHALDKQLLLMYDNPQVLEKVEKHLKQCDSFFY